MHMSNPQKSKGFTLIEMLVSLSLFTIVVTIVAGSLLVLVDDNQSIQGEQSVMSGLNFAMDSMTREIRTGTRYVCRAGGAGIFSSQESFNNNTSGDCVNGNSGNANYQGVSFVESGRSITGLGSTRVAYFYDNLRKGIYRRIGNNPVAEPIISKDIIINKAEFFVTGATPLSETGNNDVNQPAVTIVISASEVKNRSKSYIFETTVTQRQLDL